MHEKVEGDCQARYRLALALTMMIAGTIALLTLTPTTAPEVIGKGSDKLYHLIAFAALTFPSALLAPRLSAPVLSLGILFAAVIEIVQPSVGRTGEWEDFLADVVGALIGLGTGLLARRFLSPRIRKATAGSP